MHSLNTKHTTFFYNGDFSGFVEITTEEGVLKVLGRDLLDLVANHIRSKKISWLEDATTNGILGLD